MNILRYGNRKSDSEYWDISTPKKEQAAYLNLFKFLREEWNVYADLEDEVNNSSFGPLSKQAKLYQRANNGDAKAAKQLLKLRKSYEYEEWDYGTVRSPS